MPRTRRRSGVCIEPMGDRREPASSRGIDVRWSRPCNVEEPDRLMVAALIASVIAFQLNATMLIPAIRTINESSAGRVCGDVDLLLPRRCRLQRRAHPVKRLCRPQTRPARRHDRQHRALHREHGIRNHGRRSNPAGRQRHQVRTRVPDHARTSQRPGFRHNWSPSARRSR